MNKIKFIAVNLLLIIFVSSTFSQQKIDKKQMAAQVKAEFLHAWNGYKKYAWGHDDLKPVSKTYRDWYGQTILMTPVDSLDSLYLLGFKKEADATRKYITANLSFDKDISVQNFEITIRILGGLLSSYQITKDKKLLALADDLGTRLLPVFNSPTGLPYRFVNLKTGADARSDYWSSGSGNAFNRIRNFVEINGQTDLFREGETRPGRNLQTPFADRFGRRKHQRRDGRMDGHRQFYRFGH